MSYLIEYNRKIFSSPTNGSHAFAVFIKSGDNNVYTNNGHRARDWNMYWHKDEVSFWTFVGERGGYCEGGGLQRALGWRDAQYLSIEKYCEIYRKAFKQAKALMQIFNYFELVLSIELQGNKTVPMTVADIASSERRDRIEAFLREKSLQFTPSCSFHGDKTFELNTQIEDLETLSEAIPLLGRVPSSTEDFLWWVRICPDLKKGV